MIKFEIKIWSRKQETVLGKAENQLIIEQINIIEMGLFLKRDVLMGNWGNIMSSSKVVTMSLPPGRRE